MKNLLALLLFIPTLAFSSNDRIELLCDYKSTYDFDTKKTSPTSGSTSVIVGFIGESALINSSSSFCMAVGSYSDSQIDGECQKEVDGKVLQKLISINRYNGEYMESLTVEGKQGGLVHFGVCNTATKKF